MSKEKPILFSTPMVQAILEGRKTMTRRVVKKKYDNTDLVMRTDKYGTRLVERQNDAPEDEEIVMPDGSKATRCHLIAIRDVEPPYKPGDILWVRETWTVMRFAETGEEYIFYAANKKDYDTVSTTYLCDEEGFETDKPFPWRPSIHMPRKVARLFLRVTNVRVERVQDITEADAQAEGFTGIHDRMGDGKFDDVIEYDLTARTEFSELWNNLYAKNGNGWDANPWVWVIEFERCEKPQVEL